MSNHKKSTRSVQLEKKSQKKAPGFDLRRLIAQREIMGPVKQKVKKTTDFMDEIDMGFKILQDGATKFLPYGIGNAVSDVVQVPRGIAKGVATGLRTAVEESGALVETKHQRTLKIPPEIQKLNMHPLNVIPDDEPPPEKKKEVNKIPRPSMNQGRKKNPPKGKKKVVGKA